MSDDLFFQRLPDGSVVQVFPQPYTWTGADAAWRADSRRNGMDAMTVETFLNDCHWPWAVEGLRSAKVNVERGCAHREILALKFSTTVEDLLALQRTRCEACQGRADRKFFAFAEEAKGRALQLGLPELVGRSVRQVAYGLVLRDKAVLRFGTAGDFLRVALTVKDATWWIDQRARLGHLKVFSELARQLEQQPPND